MHFHEIICLTFLLNFSSNGLLYNLIKEDLAKFSYNHQQSVFLFCSFLLFSSFVLLLISDSKSIKTLRKLKDKIGLPKINKNYNHFPPFRLIIDASSTAHYGIAKYLSNLLHPLTENKFTVKYLFEAANKIQALLCKLFNEGYIY